MRKHKNVDSIFQNFGTIESELKDEGVVIYPLPFKQNALKIKDGGKKHRCCKCSEDAIWCDCNNDNGQHFYCAKHTPSNNDTGIISLKGFNVSERKYFALRNTFNTCFKRSNISMMELVTMLDSYTLKYIIFKTIFGIKNNDFVSLPYLINGLQRNFDKVNLTKEEKKVVKQILFFIKNNSYNGDEIKQTFFNTWRTKRSDS